MPLVLFVCTANICRSPMAAALFQRRLIVQQPVGLPIDDWQVASAGTWAAKGQPAASGAAAAMAERGLDLNGHRSRTVNEAMLREADLVLVMTAGHREGILAEFPFASNRVRLLSQTVGRIYDIADPYGKAAEEYEKCADELEGLIDGGFAEIVRLASAK